MTTNWKLGRECTLSIGNNPLKLAKEVTVELGGSEADVTTRDSQGVKRTVLALKELTISGTAIYSPDDVAVAIRANNFQAAAGQSKGYFIVSNVTTNTDLTSIEQFKRMTVKAKDGGFVRLEDIATVELGGGIHCQLHECRGEPRRAEARPRDGRSLQG